MGSFYNNDNGDAFGPGSMLIRLQALRSLAGIRADPYRVCLNRDF
ncbi:hypothetical protein [Mucilaginibacter dorajii]|nr:hypothetical protein [Mucilaginibacter dorajii]MCS3733588.1 hypothetical protein [Mucilaginibacter dorajii]